MDKERYERTALTVIEFEGRDIVTDSEEEENFSLMEYEHMI